MCQFPAAATSPKRAFVVVRAICRLERLAAQVSKQQDAGAPSPLRVATLNLQYFASFPEDHHAGVQKLDVALGGPCPPDVVCVQEGLAGTDVVQDVGYELAICAGAHGVAQSVREMVYHDDAALKTCKQDLQDNLLCNQLYVRRGSSWMVEDAGVEQISSDLHLAGGGGRVSGTLAVRSMSWLKLRRAGVQGPAAFVMCTHISGGRFEDQYFVQQLAEERYQQTKLCNDFFRLRRPGAQASDVGILVGDFNATEAYAANGPMNAYFKFGIAGSEGVWSDAEGAGISTQEDLESSFKTYMVSPFKALKDSGWTLAYGEEIGVTSAFGHLIDHMAVSRPVPVQSAEVIYLTNQKVNGKPADTDLVVTDHNAVKVSFAI